MKVPYGENAVEGKSEPGAIKVLGAFHVSLFNENITPSAAKQRQIFAHLALNCGRVVTTDAFIEELWGYSPPRTCVTTLQTYIRQLRSRLTAVLSNDQEAYNIINTRHGGYMLQPGWFQVDVREFEIVARQGRVMAEQGNFDAAAERLHCALEMWHGAVLADVPVGRVLELKVKSLEEMHLSVLSRRIELDMALNRHSDVVGELMMITAEKPMNENFSRLLMTALYRSGHAAGALEEYQRISTIMRNELGIDPSPELQHLQKLILERDPSLKIPLLSPTMQSGPN